MIFATLVPFILLAAFVVVGGTATALLGLVVALFAFGSGWAIGVFRKRAPSLYGLLFLGLAYLYLGKLVLLYLAPQSAADFSPYVVGFAANKDLIGQCILVSALGMAAVIVAIPLAEGITSLLGGDGSRTPVQPELYDLAFLSWVGLAVVLVIEFLIAKLNIAVMGAGATQLPFRMAGVLFYSHKYGVPAIGLLLLVAPVSDKQRPWVRAAGMAVMASFLAVEVLARASRSVFLRIGLWLLFIQISRGKGLRGALTVLAVFGTIGILAFPIISAYRFGLPLSAVLSAAGGDAGAVLLQTLNKVAYRLVGAESLLLLQGLDLGGTAGWIAGDAGLVEYYTMQVLQRSEDANIAGSPGFLGSFFFIGGTFGMIALTIGIIMLYRLLLHFATRPWLRSRVVVSTMLLSQACFALLGDVLIRSIFGLAMIMAAGLALHLVLLAVRIPAASVTAPQPVMT